MRFSLRFLILLVALCGIGLGIYERERRMNTPRVIPVRDRTSSQDSTLVTVVAYHNPRKAKANHKGSEEEHLLTPAARRRLALNLATDVTKLNIWDDGYSTAQWQVVREHPDEFLPMLDDLISAQSSMDELGYGGLIALALEDGDSVDRANKEVVRRLRQTPKKIQKTLLRFLEVQKEDWRSIDGLAEVMAPYLQSSPYDYEAGKIVYWLGEPESEMRRHLEEIQRANLSPTDNDRHEHYRLGYTLQKLKHSPLAREEVVGDLFVSLVANSSPLPVYSAGVTRHIFENDDLPWKERAIAELCKHPSREKYYKIVCEFGGVAQADYFVARLSDYRNPELAFNALVRIWDRERAVDALKQQFAGNPFALLPLLTENIGEDSAPFLLAAIDAEDPENRLDAGDVAGYLVRQELCCHNEQILERLEKAFHDGLSDDDYLKSKQLLNDMRELGFQRCDELAAKLPQYSGPDLGRGMTSSHWIVNDISCRDFANYLDQLKLGPAVNVDRILNDMKFDDWSKRIDTDRFALAALVQIGVATDIGDISDDPAKILLRLSSITRGDLAPIGAVSGPWEDHTVEMNWNKIVFEITYAPMFVHGAHKFVDALNAIVDEYRDGDERFVVYDLPRQGPTTAYLDKPVVEALSQRFGIVPVKAVPSKTP